MCLKQQPLLEVWSGGNIIQLHLFPGLAHVLFVSPLNSVTWTCLSFPDDSVQIPIEVRMAGGSLLNFIFIYKKSILKIVSGSLLTE